MKFHHGQKVKITNGYYDTYKGNIKESKITKDNKTEYLIILTDKLTKEKCEKWIPEEYLKIAWF